MDAAGWDARYAKGQVWSSEANRFFVDAVRGHGLDRPAEGARAIDLGCGEGRNAIWLAMLGWSVTGVDMSAVGIDRGRAMAESNDVSVEWIVADLESRDLGTGVWDLIALVYVHWATEKRVPFMQRVIDAPRARWASRDRGSRSHQYRTRSWRTAEPRCVDHAG